MQQGLVCHKEKWHQEFHYDLSQKEQALSLKYFFLSQVTPRQWFLQGSKDEFQPKLTPSWALLLASFVRKLISEVLTSSSTEYDMWRSRKKEMKITQIET